MTAFCDKCHRSDHESCMRLIDNLKLCRNCLINHPDGDFIFGCQCGAWDYKKVMKMLSEDNFIKCPKCNEAICVVYPEEDDRFCSCAFCSVEEAAKKYHWGLDVCQVCDWPFSKELLEKITKYEEKKRPSSDLVDHPAHYQSGGMEVIDVIEAFKLGFPLGNAVRYILRAGKKNNGLQDLQKAAWYLNHEIKKIIQSHSFKKL